MHVDLGVVDEVAGHLGGAVGVGLAVLHVDGDGVLLAVAADDAVATRLFQRSTQYLSGTPNEARGPVSGSTKPILISAPVSAPVDTEVVVAPAVVVVAPAVVVVAAAVVVVLSSVPPQAANRPPSPLLPRWWRRRRRRS